MKTLDEQSYKQQVEELIQQAKYVRNSLLAYMENPKTANPQYARASIRDLDKAIKEIGG